MAKADNSIQATAQDTCTLQGVTFNKGEQVSIVRVKANQYEISNNQGEKVTLSLTEARQHFAV